MKQSLMVMFTLIVLSLCVSWQAHAARYALVIGNGDYPEYRKGVNELTKLSKPESDARAIANLLQKYNFELVDDEGRDKVLLNADQEEMDQAVNQFINKLKASPGSQGVFYFSGHGVYLNDLLKEKNSANYLLPVKKNFSAKSPERFKYNALNAHEMVERLGNTDSQVLVLLDACRD